MSLGNISIEFAIGHNSNGLFNNNSVPNLVTSYLPVVIIKTDFTRLQINYTLKISYITSTEALLNNTFGFDNKQIFHSGRVLAIIQYNSLAKISFKYSFSFIIVISIKTFFFFWTNALNKTVSTDPNINLCVVIFILLQVTYMLLRRC